MNAFYNAINFCVEATLCVVLLFYVFLNISVCTELKIGLLSVYFCIKRIYCLGVKFILLQFFCIYSSRYITVRL